MICYIVAGGHSLHNFDWSSLNDKFVIAINRAYEVLPNAQIVYFTDLNFWSNNKGALQNHKGRKIRGKGLNAVSLPEVEEYIFSKATGLELKAGHLAHGQCSVHSAINLAVQLGFKKIYLLGVDMKRGPNGETHWHSGHEHNDPEHIFNIMIKAFDTIVEPLKKAGVEVINLNKDSALNCFPKEDFK